MRTPQNMLEPGVIIKMSNGNLKGKLHEKNVVQEFKWILPKSQNQIRVKN